MTAMTASKRPLPPGPRGNWLLGTWPQWERGLLRNMQDMVERYGDAVRYHFIGGSYGYLFTHPEHLRRILQENYRNYRKGHPTYLVMRPLVGKGILTNDGDAWLAHRRLMAPAFHRERIAALGAVMTSAASAMVERWAEAADAGRPLDVDREMTRLTLEVVGKALFGHDLQTVAAEALPAFTAVSHEVASLTVKPLGVYALRVPFLPATRRMWGNVARLDAIVNNVVARRRQSGEMGHDLLGMLLSARDEETGEGLTPRELRDELMTLMFAGHETTAQGLCWTFYLLSQHPEVEARVRRELATVLGGRLPTVEDLRALPYTHMVVQESLRLFPPVYAFPRVTREEDVVGGYRVEARAMVTLSPYLTHRHREFWPDPEQFDPTRFTPERVAARPKFAYIPFAAGPRQCIGNTFALTEIQLVLATVLQSYRLELVPGRSVEPEPMIALRPRGGLPMYVSRVPEAVEPRTAAAAVPVGPTAGGRA